MISGSVLRSLGWMLGSYLAAFPAMAVTPPPLLPDDEAVSAAQTAADIEQIEGADKDVEDAIDIDGTGEALPAEEEALDPEGYSFSHSGQALLYALEIDPQSPSDFNPGNTFAQLPKRQANAEVRLDLSGNAGPCQSNLRLRGRYTTSTDDEGVADVGGNAEWFVNTGAVRCTIGSRFFASVGRDVLQWGSGFYASPSNPFYFETGRTDPIRELYGKDNWQVGGYIDPTTVVTLIRNFRDGRLQPDQLNYSPATALKIDWVGDVASGGIVVSRTDDGIRRIGGYGTYIYSKSVVLYADAAFGEGLRGWYTAAGGSALDWRLERRRFDRSDTAYTALFGGAYTFESGWTGTVEFLTGNEGYSRSERKAYEAAVAQAADAFSAGGAATAEAAQLLGTALAPGVPYLGGNVLFLQMSRNEWNDKGDLSLRWTESLSPGRGGSFSFSAAYYLTGSVQAFALGAFNTGGERSDFGQLLRYSVLAGIRVYF
jgi:hypothetical protein